MSDDPTNYCEHKRTEARLRPDVNGNPRCQQQCLDCGEPVGKWIKLPQDISRIPKWDNNLFEESQRLKQDRKQQEFQVRRAAYHEYLKTPEWREKSVLVRKRNPVCQGCAQRPSTQAHHLTYQHIGNEFLWELVAICDECHRRVHGGDE